MSYVYADRKRAVNGTKHPETTPDQPSLEALRSGAASPTPEQKGHPVDLPDAMREKMENAFGADLSSVKLYESKTVADAGAGAVTRGTDIAFAPGMLDFSSFGGQALLGHEISHVVSQSRGEARGSGFLSDHALEAKADREGAMAAAGQTVAPPAAALSPVGAASSTAPMQAGLKKPKPKTKPDPFKFTSAPTEGNQLPSSGVGFMLGMKNLDDPTRGPAFRNLLQGMKGLAVVSQNRRHVGGQASYDAMMSNAYGSAISGLEGYKAVLEREERDGGGDDARKQDRTQQLALVNDFLARARSDQGKYAGLKTTQLGQEERVRGSESGALNEVLKFQRSNPEGESATGYFKPSLPENLRSGRAVQGEKQLMNMIGIHREDEAGNEADPALSDREIAYSRLSSLMGSSVGIGAKRATYRDTSGRTQSGVLMEEAKGRGWKEYNWNYYGPKGQTKAYDEDSAAFVKGHDPGENWGDRLGSTEMVRKSTAKNAQFKSYLRTGKNAETLDAADPDYQRQMNEMFLLDTLATHRDRHSGNFHVGRDEDGKISVKTLDNDLTFGSQANEAAEKEAFGKRGYAQFYGGLPAKMQIDANMAAKIKGMSREMLDRTFSDVLSKKEIDSLWTRFGMMKEYVGAMEKEHLIVDQWNEETAKREARLAGGADSSLYEKHHDVSAEAPGANPAGTVSTTDVRAASPVADEDEGAPASTASASQAVHEWPPPRPAQPAAPKAPEGTVSSEALSDLERYGGYSGNNYYQRQMLALHAASSKHEDRRSFLRRAEY
ncbi:MAG: DUF4157 domain-containing protein [Clostridia bacterium]|nr:DUF4157 domain-containing protein [Clostridia bacterium]